LEKRSRIICDRSGLPRRERGCQRNEKQSEFCLHVCIKNCQAEYFSLKSQNIYWKMYNDLSTDLNSKLAKTNS